MENVNEGKRERERLNRVTFNAQRIVRSVHVPGRRRDSIVELVQVRERSVVLIGERRIIPRIANPINHFGEWETSGRSVEEGQFLGISSGDSPVEEEEEASV